MSEDQKPKLRLEIGHVLFLDIVGYSKLLISEQSAHPQKLKEIVRGTGQLRSAEAEAASQGQAEARLFFSSTITFVTD